MSKLAEILVKQLAGTAVPVSYQAALGEIRQRAGSGRKAAGIIGVNESTFRRMLSGQTRTPKAATLEKARQALRVLRDRDTGLAQRDLRITWEYDGRQRTVGPGSLRLADGTVESMRAAYIKGDREGVARAFIDGIGDQFYHDRFEEIYEDIPDDYAGDFIA